MIPSIAYSSQKVSALENIFANFFFDFCRFVFYLNIVSESKYCLEKLIQRSFGLIKSDEFVYECI